jgi:intracellular sulfur oxidation DsrE/DsrF family protein
MSNKTGVTALLLSIISLVLVFIVFQRLPLPAPPAQEAADPVQEEVAATQASEEESEIKKVVWHADFANPRRFSAMLASINNMVTTYQDELVDYDVRIVFLSHGIRFLTNDKLAGTPFEEDEELAKQRDSLMGRLQSLQETQEVKLELCEITRNVTGLSQEDFIEGVESVPSGVVRISELQHQGFAYLKVE